ncbi:MAG: molybdopterin-dependent oxidoreductase FAD-binding subunit [Anaerolineae bacterium]|nr:MAG: molybdopterin-dependent oxidoreductase FAD-binding subunit [Anaerolineae bacterium]
MTSLEYHRPQTLDEALELLEQGVPLAGGTWLTPRLRGIRALVDLQDLGLDRIEATDAALVIGGTATLQGLVENAALLPDDLVRAARQEAGWNIRNKATVAGTIVTGDGRSALLTVLLALDAELEFAPGDERVSLGEVLGRGADRTGGKLIAAIHAASPGHLRYAQVARSPADRPLLCVAVALAKADTDVRVALGGFGAYPQLLSMDATHDAQEAAKVARAMYAGAGDAWASAEYRSSTAATMVARLLTEVHPE